MARKSRKHGKKVENKSADETKLRLAKLIDARKDSVESRVVVKQEHSNTKKLDDDKLKGMFANVMKKFEIKDRKPIKNDDSSKVLAISEDNTNKTNIISEEDINEGINKQKEADKTSKRQQHKLNKPSLAQLKSSVSHPEVIEWFDCDANYPQLLASIKSSKNVTPVPSHWQLKREYLSGRSLLSKKPFDLPDIIKQTDIEQMRTTLPVGGNEEADKDKSLKELSRSRVQPKMGSLDIDYKKMHDIFFKLGAKWRPNILLPFGDLYYENRNLHEESQWNKMTQEKEPGKLNPEIREIMGLQEGQLPPWCSTMNEVGLPPSYQGFKIAGLNWDIGNMKGDIYGKIILSKEDRKSTSKSNCFGGIVSFEQEDPLEEIYEKEIKGSKEVTNIEIEKPEETKLSTEDIIPISEVTVNKAMESQNKEVTNDDSEKQLYTIIESKDSKEESNLTGSATAYNLSKKAPSLVNDKEIESTEENKTSEDNLESFKF